jgi:hypothetical protein
MRLLLAGPDGSGKSSIRKLLEAGAGSQSRAVHFRVGPLLRPSTESGIESNPHASETRGLLASLAKVVCSWLDYQYRMRFTWRSQKLTIIERGFWDQLVDERRYRISPALLPLIDILSRTLPKLDMVILLTGDAGAICRRKNEISQIETERQLKVWSELAPRIGHQVVTLDTVRQSEVETGLTLEKHLVHRPAFVTLVHPRGRQIIFTRRFASRVDDVHQTSRPLHGMLLAFSALPVRRVAPAPALTAALQGVAAISGRVDDYVACQTPSRGRVHAIVSSSGHEFFVKASLDSAKILREGEMLTRIERAPVSRTWKSAGMISCRSEVGHGVLISKRLRLKRAVLTDDQLVSVVSDIAENLGARHGDFAPWNVCIDRSVLHVIDWEEWADGPDAYYDALTYYLADLAVGSTRRRSPDQLFEPTGLVAKLALAQGHAQSQGRVSAISALQELSSLVSEVPIADLARQCLEEARV